MNEISPIYFPEALASFLTREECFSIEKTLEKQMRVSMLTERYFVKAGVSNDPKNIQSLKNEIKVYTTFSPDSIGYPKLKWYRIDNNLVILILERIDALALAERRDAFNIHPSANTESILSEISKLERAKIPENWPVSYHRDEKIEKYGKIVFPYLPQDIRIALDSLVGSLHMNENLVFSHGDLLPMNIMINQEQYWFVDWEWADIRPASFDPAFFLLFSRPPSDGITFFEKCHMFWNPVELYRDTVVISLHEMKLWITQVDPSSLQVKRINMWLLVLKEAVEWLMLH